VDLTSQDLSINIFSNCPQCKMSLTPTIHHGFQPLQLHVNITIIFNYE